MKTALAIRLLALAALLLGAAPSRAVMVSYTANLSTSKGNPVTHLLILESDGEHPVQASVYPSDVPGHGTTTITHDALYPPVRSLLIGVTEGVDDDGSDKTQLVMLLDPAFAAAHAGIPFSTVFPGARHSETIAHLVAAVAGDAAELAWFTDTFFSGPAAGAPFASGGAFTVAEFTSLKMIGQNATAGSWMITAFQSLPANNPNAQSNKVTAVLSEVAKGDRGPFDIGLFIDGDGVFAVDKTVVNNTGVPWTQFALQLGTGVGSAFVPSTFGDSLEFDDTLANRETTGAFPDAVVGKDLIVFRGTLPPGGTARFVVFVRTSIQIDHLVTIRQIAPVGPAPAPMMRPELLVVLAAALAVFAARRLRAAR